MSLEAEKVVCALCRRQFARYLCPNCNVPYCSLTCFRSSTHSNCSEGFYKKEIEHGIRSEGSKSAEERIKMLEILKKFEEEQNELEHDDEDEADSELVQQLKDVNLDSPEEVWDLLTPEQRDRFLKTIADPKSELAQQLMASEGFDPVTPWWEANDDAQPEMNPAYANIKGKSPPGAMLLYNICSVLMAYVYTIRTLNLSLLGSANGDEREEAIKLISHIVPFLTTRNSKTVLTSVDQMVISFWSAVGKDGNSDLLGVVFKDTTALCCPRRIRVATAESPYVNALLAISDMSDLFSLNKGVIHKLFFYATHIALTRIEHGEALVEQLRKHQLGPTEQTSTRGNLDIVPESPQMRIQQAKIEEVN